MRIEVFRESIDNPTPAFSAVQYMIDTNSVLEAGATALDARATIPDGSPVWYNITGDDGSHVRKFSINHETVSQALASDASGHVAIAGDRMYVRADERHVAVVGRRALRSSVR